MPSRPTPPPLTAQPPTLNHHNSTLPSGLVPPVAAAGATAAVSCLLLIFFCFRKKLTQKRTVPEAAADAKPPHRYSYAVLRRATDSFAASNLLGQGGFGSVFRGTLPANPQKQVAVKVMDSGSLQGEREFHNEIFIASKLDPLNDNIISVLGFSSDRKRRRMLLVYELMNNGNLQDALLRKKRPELMEWKKRFSIAVDIAKGIAYLHSLSPPVIHDDIKPSNILLDGYFCAKIADFGLARLKEERNQDHCEIAVVGTTDDDQNPKMNGGDLESDHGGVAEDYGSVVEEEMESVMTGFEESNLAVDQSPGSFADASPVTAAAATAVLPDGLEKGSTSTAEANIENKSRALVANATKRSDKGMKEWWWKQEKENQAVVKDYVMEWLGTGINKERPKGEWIAAASATSSSSTKLGKKKNNKRWDWWVSMDADDDKEKKLKSFKKEKRRPAREWWKEEYCEELAKKQKKKRKKKQQMGISGDDDWWPGDEEMYSERKKKSRSRSSRSSRGSMDWWLDGLSGELFRRRLNSHDSGAETPKSGVSSTPSMRGTVCYIAPEYGGGEDVSEKCDVYSFGVLLLVLIAGRRPLQVTGSPMAEFQRANLLSWARHLARNGKLIELVDRNVQSFDREQALLCITVALLCLQKSPACRPSMKEAVAMLTGESQPPPQLPTEFSPPQSRFPRKSHKKVR